MKRLLVLIIVLAALTFAGVRMGYLRWPAAPQTTAEAGRRGDGSVVVTLGDVTRADVPVTLDAIGTVTPLESVNIRSQVDGRLLSLAFKDGQDVKAGDLLALIDPAVYQAQYDLALAKKAMSEATLANARIDLERYNKLAVGNFGSRQQADTQSALVRQLEAQTRQDQATIDNARTILGYTSVRSPIDGRTGVRLTDPGNLLQAGNQTGIVVVTKLRPISVQFTLAQQYLRLVNTALSKGSLSVQALESDNRNVLETGQVYVVDNQVDPATGTVKIRAVFPNKELVLWPGQFTNIRLFVSVIRDAVVVPVAAVQRGPGGAYVYVERDGSVVQTPVTTGQQNEVQAVIVSGVVPPARVATSGFARLTNGAKVRVIEAAPNAASGESKPGAEAVSSEGINAGASKTGTASGDKGGERRRIREGKPGGDKASEQKQDDGKSGESRPAGDLPDGAKKSTPSR